jgi:uncharacterized protein YraI
MKFVVLIIWFALISLGCSSFNDVSESSQSRVNLPTVTVARSAPQTVTPVSMRTSASTATPRLTRTIARTATPTRTQTIARTATPVSMRTSASTATPRLTRTIARTATPTRTQTIARTATPASMRTSARTATSTLTQAVARTTTQTAMTAAVMVEALVNVNVRSGPGTGYVKYGTLMRGERLPVLGVEADAEWYAVSFDGKTGWITADRNLTRLIPESAKLVTVPTPTSAVLRTTQRANVSVPQEPTSLPQESYGVECPGFSYTCKQLTCEQARACLAAGNNALDRDGDGIPCESKCK